jgi:hypothetical protein
MECVSQMEVEIFFSLDQEPTVSRNRDFINLIVCGFISPPPCAAAAVFSPCDHCANSLHCSTLCCRCEESLL